MTASSRGSRAVSALLRGSPRICTCASAARQPTLSQISTRLYSAAAATPSPASSEGSDLPPPPAHYATTPQHAPSAYTIKSGLILTRPPLLTRTLHPFETAFFLYQKRLEERLSAPFRKEFYFRRDTPAELDWRLKTRERHGVAGRDIGRYNPRGRLGWNDEVLSGSPWGMEEEKLRQKIVEDATMRVSEDGEEVPVEDRVGVEGPLPRKGQADERGDLKALDREMGRTLYLVVQKGGMWMFPNGTVRTDENLHESAARILAEAAGINMNTWIVGRVPVAHTVTKPVVKEDQVETKGAKTFFLKGRIMAGQVDLSANTRGLTDFQWLTREELQGVLPGELYRSARLMMADR